MAVWLSRIYFVLLFALVGSGAVLAWTHNQDLDAEAALTKKHLEACRIDNEARAAFMQSLSLAERLRWNAPGLFWWEKSDGGTP